MKNQVKDYVLKIVILDALTFGESELGGFDKFGNVVVYQTTSPTQSLARIKDADVIVTNKVVIDETLMDETENLKLICVAATGMNNIDLEAAKEKNIAVKNVAGYSTDSVIQHTFSMLFYLVGHSRYYDEYVKSNEWSKSAIFTNVTMPFGEIKGKKYGIIGLGEIGRGVAKIASTFGSEICYYSTSGKNSNSEFQRVELDEMLSSCDIISIHAPLNEQTKNLLDYEKLSKLKDGSILLNLGRGGIVNEDDLSRILDEKNIFVGLDVLEKEPMKKDHPLLKIKNLNRLYITPHIAWASIEARDTLIEKIIINIDEFLQA